MNKNQKLFVVMLALCAIFGFGLPAAAQERAGANEEYSGSIISYNGPRVQTALFTLRINGRTSDQQASQFLTTLRDNGQRQLLDAIDNEDLGRFSIGGNVGIPINVVRESVVDGQRRIFIVFERYTRFAELRGGYRSIDYPFGVIELFINERTGRGEGTYIAAARIDWDEDSRTSQQRVEIENFATYPAKLTAVTRRGDRRRR